MANRTEQLSDAQKRSIEWIKAKRAEELGALGVEIGKMLAELTVELADAKAEAGHWRAAFESVRAEIQILVAVCLKKLKLEKLVITRAALQELPPNLALYVGEPEPGVREYELRRAETLRNAVRGIIRKH